MKSKYLHYWDLLFLTNRITWAVFHSAFASFLPENDLHLQDIPEGAGLTEQEFNDVIDLAEEFYAPLLKESYGVTAKFNRLWSTNTVNANASQRGRTWIVNMYGGLARRPEITPDGFAYGSRVTNSVITWVVFHSCRVGQQMKANPIYLQL